MNLTDIKNIFIKNGCRSIYVKELSANDNSKNQVYLGGSFDILNVFPISSIVTVPSGDWERERFSANMKFSWINDNGNLCAAPHSKLILYPKYPEVRFSGFLKGAKDAPSNIMTQRLAGRILLMAVTANRIVIGHVAHPDSEMAREIKGLNELGKHGVFSVIELFEAENSRNSLLSELARIHRLDWIESKRLDTNGQVLPCLAPNCGGYTLEAELGITPNGYSEPDFRGWEIKQFGVSNFQRLESSVITLMTPEPTDGLYKTRGVDYFVRKYGYEDRTGREDRMNFGGIHKIGKVHPLTHLEMRLVGFDQSSGKIRNSDGKIVLLDRNENEAASWSFSSMLLHWNRKHNKACYVPSQSMKNGFLKYKFGNVVILGIGTDFQLFLSQMALGNIYYDPGIKIENMATKPKTKKRSQFRIKSGFLSNLYKINEVVDVACQY